MKQLDIQNFETNMKQFYLEHEFEKTPLLEGYLLLKYPRDMREPMNQKSFNDYARLVFIQIDPKEIQKAVSAATNIIINMVLPYCKSSNNKQQRIRRMRLPSAGTHTFFL